MQPVTYPPADATTAAEPRGYGQALTEAITVLTEAARLTHPVTTGSDRETRVRIDFAEFVTLAIAGAVANIGSTEQALAGRPGSWEAGCVRSMLTSTVGDDDAHLMAHRTEPLTITVDIEDLLTDLGYAQLYDDAKQEVCRREMAITAAIPDLQNVTPGQETDLAFLDQLRDAVDELRQRDFADYGQAFTATVRHVTAKLLPGLRVPVEVQVELSWQGRVGIDESPWGPVFALWERARDLTPLPGSGMAPADYPPGVDIAQVERDSGRGALARIDAHPTPRGEQS